MKNAVLTSRDNPTVKAVAKLVSSSAARAEQKRFVLEGARLCEDAAKTAYSIESVFCTKKALDLYEGRLTLLIERCESFYTVSQEVFEKLCDTSSPQGVLAVCKMPEEASLSLDYKGVYLALENIQDPANLGAMARTAEALGISAIITSAGGCDPFSPKAQRSAMGSLLRLPVIKSADFNHTLSLFKQNGCELVAAVVNGARENLSQNPLSKNCVIIIGNEGNGICEQTVSMADRLITINMKGRNESLNAAAAASLFMWEATKEQS